MLIMSIFIASERDMMKKITKDNYESIVYISHAFQGNPDNVSEIEDIISTLQEQYPNYLFISPVHTFGFLYDKVDYDKGLEMTLFLLDTCCDEMWYTPDENSRGVATEIAYCKEYNIPYKNIDEVLKC